MSATKIRGGGGGSGSGDESGSMPALVAELMIDWILGAYAGHKYGFWTTVARTLDWHNTDGECDACVYEPHASRLEEEVLDAWRMIDEMLKQEPRLMPATRAAIVTFKSRLNPLACSWMPTLEPEDHLSNHWAGRRFHHVDFFRADRSWRMHPAYMYAPGEYRPYCRTEISDEMGYMRYCSCDEVDREPRRPLRHHCPQI
jgi:hypothetical protein